MSDLRLPGYWDHHNWRWYCIQAICSHSQWNNWIVAHSRNLEYLSCFNLRILDITSKLTVYYYLLELLQLIRFSQCWKVGGDRSLESYSKETTYPCQPICPIDASPTCLHLTIPLSIPYPSTYPMYLKYCYHTWLGYLLWQLLPYTHHPLCKQFVLQIPIKSMLVGMGKLDQGACSHAILLNDSMT